ncbi:MAG: GyrI-like domain-containing protein [Terracidiphilus sp.]|jgi:effector-binding domain-containing protein
MNLTESGDIVQWPETHYVFVEKTGPIPKIARDAWQTALSLAPQLAEKNQIAWNMSLYRMNPSIYRAGFVVAEQPAELPAGLEYEFFGGGKYSRFVLTGPFSDLPAATSRVFEIVAQRGVTLRSDFCIESYVSDPRATPEDKLVTEILIPTA